MNFLINKWKIVFIMFCLFWRSTGVSFWSAALKLKNTASSLMFGSSNNQTLNLSVIRTSDGFIQGVEPLDSLKDWFPEESSTISEVDAF